MVIILMTLYCSDAKWKELNKSYISIQKGGWKGVEKGEENKSKIVELLSK